MRTSLRADEQSVEKVGPGGLDLSEWRLCARVARLYYESDMTQEQIGELLGLSRMKVNRLLRAGLRSGVTEIIVHGPDEPFSDLEDHLITRHRLRDARVVPELGNGEALTAGLGAAAADWLAGRLEPDLVVGVGLGRTVAAMAKAFEVEAPVDAMFVAVEGVASSPTAGFSSYNVTAHLAEAAGASFGIISAPTFVTDKALRDGLIEEPSVRAALARARNADIVVQSVGTVTTNALLHLHGLLSTSDLAELREMGAVGDALGHYFDRDGGHIPYWTDDIHVGLTLADLTRVPVSAMVAGGENKVEPIRAALSGGYFNVLITDAPTARSLLEVADDS